MFACLVVVPGLAACAPSAPSTAQAGDAGEPSSPPAAPGQPQATTGGTAAPGARAPQAPADAALQLEALLGQHAILTADLTRGRLRNDEDFAQAANVAVGRNTDELVGTLSGEQQVERFRGLWADHVTALFNYSRGLATQDTAVRDEAWAALNAFSTDAADFFAAASQGRLDREAARTALSTHDDHLTQQADAYPAGDYPGANTRYREGYRNSFELGNTLAGTLLPADEAADLQSIDLLGTYAADVGAKKENRREAVRDDLRDWQLRFATYPQVWGIARNMADAFGATLAAQMPQGGAQTGGGGMAGALVPPALPPVAGSGPVRPGPR